MPSTAGATHISSHLISLYLISYHLISSLLSSSRHHSMASDELAAFALSVSCLDCKSDAEKREQHQKAANTRQALQVPAISRPDYHLVMISFHASFFVASISSHLISASSAQLSSKCVSCSIMPLGPCHVTFAIDRCPYLLN